MPAINRETRYMNRELLGALKQDGYNYLVKKHNEKAFTPVKGSIETALKMLSAAPLMEDSIISIDEALHLADTEGLISEMIIIKNNI